MQDNNKLVCFAHGKESGPWGTKIRYLSGIAEQRGWTVTSPDYSHTQDPEARVAQLLRAPPTAERLVLCGSSMGGYVSAMACPALGPQGLFLLAPAVHMPGFDGEPDIGDAETVVIHGWRDTIVPPDSAIRFAREHRARLHMLDDAHRLVDSLEFAGATFADLLDRMDLTPSHD